VVSVLVPVVVDQFRILVNNLPEFANQFQGKYPALYNTFGSPNVSDIFQNILGGGDGEVFSRTVGVFSGLLGFVTVLVISFYLVVADENGMKELIRPLVPAAQQDTVMHLVHRIQKKMGMWVLGQLVLSASIFVLTFVALTLLGVKYALVLALLAGLLEVVPYIGPFLSAVPAFFFALVQGPALAAVVVILYVIIQKIEGYVLVPKIMHKAVGTSPLVVLLSLLIGFKLAGIVGLLLAVPIASAVMVIIAEFRGEQGAEQKIAKN
jgi:predicted PurR-regulated permease PerM